MKKQAALWLMLTLSVVMPIRAEVVFKGESQGMPFEVEVLAENLGVPWGMTFIDERQIFFTRREGGAGLLDLKTSKVVSIKGVPEVSARGQGGFLDVIALKDKSGTGWLYFTWVKRVDGKGVTVLSRARLQGNTLSDWQDLLVTDSATDTERHFGSRMAVDNAGHIFFSVGDRGHRPNGQDLSTHAGSVLRLNLDGSVPEDNPFVGRGDARSEIWSYGHRNPQGLAWDGVGVRLWEIEHGPRGGDEINLIQPGGNYGWPTLSYGKEYWGPIDVGEGTEREGMVSPVKVYVPSIAPGSLLYYTGDAFPAWRGNLIAGALKLTHLNRVTLDEKGKAISEERLLVSLGERIRALIQGPEGWLYFSTDSGKIMRLKP
ncbi:PQQ-dependent oxidoreductase, gdhB family [Marinobacterium lacunae]|uniref:PQQ-dependent oxidoreductase, gdhB family n=1 Tax=Marinobacterium lacunae TaxID=1232683 RepID=A0A081FZE0_9GAMM|nr:PQQ-dependent sugar dehydrogenase [Marinobacterium lacunae]KEA63895.1 PQQ-dependent oxidoreductase, gdhB family [Marinobacterium lacunae]